MYCYEMISLVSAFKYIDSADYYPNEHSIPQLFQSNISKVFYPPMLPELAVVSDRHCIIDNMLIVLKVIHLCDYYPNEPIIPLLL